MNKIPFNKTWDFRWVRFFQDFFNVQDWQEVQSFLGTWANTGTTFANAGFYKDPLEVVHLRGKIDTGSSGTDAFQLPKGFRPSKELGFGVWGGTVLIDTDGYVNVTGTAVHLEGIYFRVDK